MDLKKIGLLTMVMLVGAMLMGCSGNSSSTDSSDQYTCYWSTITDRTVVVDDGDTESLKFSDMGKYRISIDSDVSVNVYIDHNNIEGYDYKAEEVKNYHNTIDMGSPDIYIENPSTFGLGDDANVDVTVETRTCD